MNCCIIGKKGFWELCWHWTFSHQIPRCSSLNISEHECHRQRNSLCVPEFLVLCHLTPLVPLFTTDNIHSSLLAHYTIYAYKYIAKWEPDNFLWHIYWSKSFLTLEKVHFLIVQFYCWIFTFYPCKPVGSATHVCLHHDKTKNNWLLTVFDGNTKGEKSSISSRWVFVF